MSQAHPPRMGAPDLLHLLKLASGCDGLESAYAISRWLTRATPGRPRHTAGDLGRPWERLVCHTPDGLRLVGWAVLPPCPRGTVALFHDLHAGREHTLAHTAFLVAAGYRCVAFDHRAHGESDGRRTSFGYREAGDVKAVLDVIQQRWPRQPCAALGVGLGAAALTFAAAHTRRLDAVILEGLCPDLGGVLRQRLRTRGYPPWFRRLSQTVLHITEQRLGLPLTQLAPIDHVGALAPAPLLLLPGTEEDGPAATPSVRLLAARCRGPHTCALVSSRPEEASGSVPPFYREVVLAFLQRWLGAAARGRAEGSQAA